MDRPVSEPGIIRGDRTGLPATTPNEPEVPPAPERSSFGWRVTLFVWVTAFIFLVAYEMVLLVLRLFKVR